MTIAAIARAGAGEEVLLGAPQIGVWCDPLPPGTPVAPGVVLGTLVQLGRKHTVVAPRGVTGIVSGPAPRDRRRAVGYGETLLSVSPLAAMASEAQGSREETGSSAGTYRVVAPTDGVFYPAASPGGAPFAPKGSRLHAGSTIGLIEVMKTFNPIAYGGGALPETAEVVEVLAGHGEEVRAGQTLLVVR